uniref:Peptidase C39-like domain-containing protein n=1 Tax=Caldilinea aerophila TaxID=133453 RepID=A0A7C1FDB9_9CHLR
MSPRRLNRIILSIVLALLVTASVHAQGPGPKVEPFVPAAPASPTPSRSPAFRQAAEAALQAYLEAHGPAAPLARLALDEQGRAVHVEEPASLSPMDADAARQAALRKIRNVSDRGIAKNWQDAVLDNAIPLYDLSGEVVAYLFPVRRDGEPASSLTVVALNLPNPVLEFATEGPAPLDGMPETLRRQGMALRAPERPLYLGLLGYAYEVIADKARTRRVLRLLDGQMLDVPETEARIPLRQHIRLSDVQSQSAAPQAYRFIPGVPDWNQFWGSYGCWSGCSPTAVINAMGYWDSQGGVREVHALRNCHSDFIPWQA